MGEEVLHWTECDSKFHVRLARAALGYQGQVDDQTLFGLSQAFPQRCP